MCICVCIIKLSVRLDAPNVRMHACMYIVRMYKSVRVQYVCMYCMHGMYV